MININEQALRKAIKETIDHKEKSASTRVGINKYSEHDNFSELLHPSLSSLEEVSNFTKKNTGERVYGVYLREEVNTIGDNGESLLDTEGIIKIGKGYYIYGELTREDNDHASYSYKDLDLFLPCESSDASYVMESIILEYYKECNRWVKNEICSGFKRETVIDEISGFYRHLTGKFNIQKEDFNTKAYEYQHSGSTEISDFLSDDINSEFFLMYKPRAGKNATTLLGFGKHNTQDKNNLCLVTGLWPSAFIGLWNDIDDNHYEGKNFEYINTKDLDWEDQLKKLKDRGDMDWIFLCASMQSIDESVKGLVGDINEEEEVIQVEKVNNAKLESLLNLNISHCIVDESDHGIRTGNSQNVLNKFSFNKTIYLSGTDLYAIKHEISDKPHAIRTLADEIKDTLDKNSTFKKPIPVFYTVDYADIPHSQLKTGELKHQELSRTLESLQKTNVDKKEAKTELNPDDGLYYSGDIKIEFSREDEFHNLFKLVYTSDIVSTNNFKPANSVKHLFATFQSINALYAFHNMFVSRNIDPNTKILIANQYPDAETREKNVNKAIKTHGGNTIFCSKQMMLRGAKAPWEGVMRFDDFSSFSVGHQLQLRGQNGGGEFFYVYDANVFRSHKGMYDLAKNSRVDQEEDPKTMLCELMEYIPYLTNGEDFRIKKHKLDHIMDSINEIFSVRSDNFSESLFNKNYINNNKEDLTYLFSKVEGEGSNNISKESDNKDHRGQSKKIIQQSANSSKDNKSKTTQASVESKIKRIYFQLPWLLISQKGKKFQTFRELLQSIDNKVFTVWINRVGIFNEDINQVKQIILLVFNESEIGHRVLFTMDKINSGEYNLSSLDFIDKENRPIPDTLKNNMLDKVKIEEANSVLVLDTLGQTTKTILERFATIDKKGYTIVICEPNTLSYLYMKESLDNGDSILVINNLESIKEMKFDVVIGNPPYQELNENTSDDPIYHDFMEDAYKMSSKVLFITPARFLFNAGKTPKKWNKKMLNDDHLKVVWYESKSTKVFPNVDIKGGIVVTLRDCNKSFGKIGFFCPYEELKSISNKVLTTKEFTPITEIIHLQNKFNLENLYRDHPRLKDIIGSKGKEKRLTSSIFSQVDIISDEPVNEDDVRIFGLIDNKRVFKWIKKEYLLPHENTHKFKVLVPKANGTGQLGEKLSTPVVMGPNTGFTFSFISFGSFEDKIEAEAALEYIKTKFLRSLLGILKVTQDNLQSTWAKIPLQDFTSNSDIDWNQSISDIDKQMYIKYNLSEEEISFIESNIKPMN
tara:strand:- start:8 stop:3811 length:3804 start_codon:yes stop_codon:yes gene_type:complete